MGAEIGMLVVETIAKIRRAYFVHGQPIKYPFAIALPRRCRRRNLNLICAAGESPVTEMIHINRKML
ncbi:MAG: hypothetical protein EXQ83_01400 [Xanthobacteraceae bacterium]|nr:hypothetical protein [Xanthobacteraceae bacterium]